MTSNIKIEKFLPLSFSKSRSHFMLTKTKAQNQNQPTTTSTKATTKATTATTTATTNNTMFLQKAALISLTVAPFFAQGYQLRRRQLQDDTCVPAGVAPFLSSAFVMVDIEGENSNIVTDIQLEQLASTFESSYNGLVNCDARPGSVRALQQVTAVPGAVGPIGFSSYLLRLDFFCNACGEGEVDVFSALDEAVSNVPDTQCACEGPETAPFLVLFGNLFEDSTSSLRQIATVEQIAVLDCPPQNTTTFNSTGVCLGPEGRVLTTPPSGTSYERSSFCIPSLDFFC
jgi:hypothetical protein